MSEKRLERVLGLVRYGGENNSIWTIVWDAEGKQKYLLRYVGPHYRAIKWGKNEVFSYDPNGKTEAKKWMSGWVAMPDKFSNMLGIALYPYGGS